MDVLDQLITQVVSLNGHPLIVVLIIMVGYMLKMLKPFPNKYIPWVGFVLGPILTLILVGPPSTGSMSPRLFWPDLAAYVSCFCTGFLLFCVAWVTHAKFLRKVIDDQVAEMNPGRVTEKTEAERTVTGADGKVASQQVSEERTVDTTPAPVGKDLIAVAPPAVNPAP